MTGSKEIFVYDWASCEDPPSANEQMVLLLYGIDAAGETICVNVTGFRPYFYVEIGETRDLDFLDHRTLGALREFLGLYQSMNSGVELEVVSREGLYFANYDPVAQARKKFQIVKISAPTRSRLSRIYWKIASPRGDPFRVGMRTVKLYAHEFSRVDHLMQFRCSRNLPATGWISAKSFRTCRVKTSQHSTCNLEILCRDIDLVPTPADRIPCAAPPLNVVIFDLETYSSDWSRVSDSGKETDEIFQVSFASSRGDRIVVVSRPIDRSTVRPGIRVIEVDSEKDLLKEFPRVMRDLDPHIISGYNVFGFDFPYLSDRAALHGIHDLVFSFARVKQPAAMQHIEWGSKGRGLQDFHFPRAEGQIVLDLLVYIKKTYTMHSYRLDAVAETLLNAHKDPFTYRDIFRSFAGLDVHKKPLAKPDRLRLMTTCLNYCMQDSDLTLRLFTTQCVDLVMVQMSSVTNTDINQIATRGETILTFNLVYKHCTDRKILVESKDYYSDIQSEIYSGATILDPDAGIHENVVSFDFAALYPSVIRAFNIDYTTLIDETQASASLIPDTDCHVIEWDQHQGCEHDPAMIRRLELLDHRAYLVAKMSLLRSKKISKKDVGRCLLRNAELGSLNAAKLRMTEELKKFCNPKFTICKHFRFRYIKRYGGVIPTVVVDLLTARKRIKKQIVELRAQWTAEGTLALTPEQTRELEVLDKRQLAFKITANSMFGLMGARQGMLTFMPGAISTTASGRKCIAKMIDLFQTRYNARVIYGDTDSNYVILDPTTYTTPTELWDVCGRLAKEISACYPEAITLEFEDAIYSKFLIPTKKKYLHRKIGRDGSITNPLHTKGSCLVRRDTFGFMRTVFRDLVTMIFDGQTSVETIETFLAEQIRILFSRSVAIKDLVLTKSVKTITPAEKYTIDGNVCHLGAYTLKKVPANLTPQNAWEKLVPLLPEHAAVAYLLKQRGAQVSCGSRIEYVYVEPLHDSHDRGSQQVESVHYLDRTLRDIHVGRYASRLRQPIEQILPFVNRRLTGAVHRHICHHTNYAAVVDELKTLFTPEIIFVNSKGGATATIPASSNRRVLRQ